jgi:hypothetical protein
MSPARGELPYVDERAITIAACTGVERAVALHRHSLRIPGSPIARLLGTQLRAGFEVLDSAPDHSLTLAGRHRLARCRLHPSGPVGLEYTVVTVTCYFSQRRGAVRRRSGIRV